MRLAKEDRHAYSLENLSSVIQKEFCNTIEGKADIPPVCADVCK
jgi:hypothetical protein